eukprot:TRINITY_DN39111_c0_g1_i1.p2 TRINITY_DN39111_c0_g1~~TRINITY_DN39111_c0_g1_i1.p2  ORF type:complete len:176 (-),score=32.53 TRINITY_DN39111_c0_g1_i1:627-1154(-)
MLVMGTGNASRKAVVLSPSSPMRKLLISNTNKVSTPTNATRGLIEVTLARNPVYKNLNTKSVVAPAESTCTTPSTLQSSEQPMAGAGTLSSTRSTDHVDLRSGATVSLNSTWNVDPALMFNNVSLIGTPPTADATPGVTSLTWATVAGSKISIGILRDVSVSLIAAGSEAAVVVS